MNTDSLRERANRTLGSQDVKDAAFNGLVHPVLWYGSCVWEPKGLALQEEIEKVQNSAARFVTSSYCFEFRNWMELNSGNKMGVIQEKVERR